MKRALLTGISGQDGSYLAELLLEKGYEVHGLIRRSSSFNTQRIEHLYQDPHEEGCRFFLHYGDLLDSSSLLSVLKASRPDEVYNLAAQSHVRVSFDQPVYTADVVALGAVRLFEAVRQFDSSIRIYQATSSEIFGNSPPPQDEKTPLDPQSPYAAAKAFAYHSARNYRDAYGLFIANGILFNHESPRRHETFVTRKITRAVTRIKCGLQKILYLGNIDARRDWGHAKDYVRAMWMMLQRGDPDDFVIGTGETHSVKDFLELATVTVGFDKDDWTDFVEQDPRYQRPTEVNCLQAGWRKAALVLGWKPEYDFGTLVREMVMADWALAEKDVK